MFEQFTEKAIASIMSAEQCARDLSQKYLGTELILLGLFAQADNVAAQALTEVGVTYDSLFAAVKQAIGSKTGFTPQDIPFTPKAKQLLERAVQEGRKFEPSYVGPEHLLLAITADPSDAAAKVLQKLDINLQDLRNHLVRTIGEQLAVPVGSGPAEPRRQRKNSALQEFARDLTQLAAEGKIDPVIGRHQEIERVVQILGRRTKNNPILIGEPGVGKTAIAEGLAQRIVDQDVPESLLDQQVMSLDVGGLVAGTRFRGDFEERLKQVMAEVQQAGNIILVIDEVHTLVGAGGVEGGMDAANLLKPALARGELQCIGATTLDEYRKYIEKDAALERRFQPVQVNEPSVADTIEILHGLRQRYEEHHRLTISDAALTSAATLAYRYINDRFLPDKAIDLIDEAGSRVRLRNRKPSATEALQAELNQLRVEFDNAVKTQDFERASHLRDREQALEVELNKAKLEASVANQPSVGSEDIAEIVAAWTGIPVTQLSETESSSLLQLEDKLHERVIGQNDAINAVAKAIRRARVGLRNLNRPIASFIFCGPTGVGKTELAKALAASVFGSEEAMVRLDMSEYMERQSVAKLIGSPPGYVGYGEGGQLTEAVRRQPYTVLLLDEIEKAHPDVFNLLLQLLEDGRLTDSQGRVVNFNNILVIMTSNLGSRAIQQSGSRLGFETIALDAETAKYSLVKDQLNEALKMAFRPEFINRLDDVIVFRQLTRSEVKEIGTLLIQTVNDRLQEQNIRIEVSSAFEERLVTAGYDPSYGARPLRRAVSRLVEDSLAEAILSGQIQSGDSALLDIGADGEVQVKKQVAPALVGSR